MSGFALLTILSSAAVIAAARQQQPTFRSAVDLIAVDVQVVNGQGMPLTGLDATRFEVSINRHKRRVVSADLLKFDASVDTLPGSVPLMTTPAPLLAEASKDGRVFILAIDVMSFQPAATREVVASARHFVESLQPSDMVGLYLYPDGPPLQLTTSHANVIRDLERVIGRGDPAAGALNRFQLTPTDIIDLTSLRTRDPREPPRDPELVRRIAEICSIDRDPVLCNRFLVSDALAVAAFEEGRIVQRVTALRAMLSGLATSSRRKTIVLMSTGILATDRPGGRPDLEDLGNVIGQDAARANATIYTMFIDRRQDESSASRSRRSRPTDNPTRDSAILARPLGQVSGASGGAQFTVAQGSGPAFDRILKETSSYYLLGVEPDESDRDGKPRTLGVKVNTGERGTTIRARQWVVVPKR